MRRINVLTTLNDVWCRPVELARGSSAANVFLGNWGNWEINTLAAYQGWCHPRRQLMVSPYFFLPQFQSSLLESDDFLAVVSLPPQRTPSRGETRLKFISFLCPNLEKKTLISARKKYF